jgi:hypothetical protein
LKRWAGTCRGRERLGQGFSLGGGRVGGIPRTVSGLGGLGLGVRLGLRERGVILVGAGHGFRERARAAIAVSDGGRLREEAGAGEVLKVVLLMIGLPVAAQTESEATVIHMVEDCFGRFGPTVFTWAFVHVIPRGRGVVFVIQGRRLGDEGHQRRKRGHHQGTGGDRA